MEIIQNSFLKKFDLFILAGIFLCVILVPSIKITSTFYIGLEELLIFIAFCRILQQRYFAISFYLKIVLLFAFYIFLTILINGRIFEYSEYFESYKVMKFIIIVQFVSLMYLSYEFKVKKVIEISFLILFGFNMLHYFNLFNFNHLIYLFYDIDGRDIIQFGKNSIGQPATKRMLGTMGNPNVNSILFLFFFTYFMYKTIQGFYSVIWQQFYFILSALSVILCQSRTGIFILVLLFCCYVFYSYKNYKRVILIFLILLGLLSIIYLLDVYTFKYITNFKMNSQENTSLSGRLEIWKLLGDQILQKPIFGWGPNKNYMYSNNIYPENEYIFMAWRFGFIGLFFYLFWLIYPFKESIKKDGFKNNFYLYVLLVVLICALSNNPITESRIFVLFSLIVGVILAKNNKGINENIS
jgi:O-antigen ligase